LNTYVEWVPEGKEDGEDETVKAERVEIGSVIEPESGSGVTDVIEVESSKNTPP
jgi:hypothetical protein